MPTASGSSAATTPRKTISETRNSSGKASSSARARSSCTCSPACSPITSGPPSATCGSALQALDDRLGVRAVAQRHRDVARPPVLRDELVRPARLVRVDARDLRVRPQRARPRASFAWPAAESAGAPSRTSATTSGVADAPVARAIASRACTASAAGGSKSSSESSSPATRPADRAGDDHEQRRRRRARGGGGGTSGGRASRAWERLLVVSGYFACGRKKGRPTPGPGSAGRDRSTPRPLVLVGDRRAGRATR